MPERWGNAHASIVPYQAFRAADGYVVLAVGNDGQWARFCEAAGVAAWARDGRFATNSKRVAGREALVPMLEDLFGRRTVAEWLALCSRADVPAGPVNTVDKVFADPQARARGMLVELARPSGGTVRMAGSPLKLSDTPVQMRLPPPRLGEHTEEVLRTVLGLDEEAFATLRKDGVV